ncbi:unnamed protein product [Ranitomeya imitator]|uniref:Cytochrome c oxidase assembly factor 3 n=1 Tax=Ranitomeya imitator TaxID=111125 RepID=A0ABN9LI90_9NEOB|nr:unnamed protein product [Ranitomeya imitator]
MSIFSSYFLSLAPEVTDDVIFERCRQINMAEKGSTQGSGARDAKKQQQQQQQALTPEQMALLRRREMAQWANSGKLRMRNVITGLAIGGVVLGICFLTGSTDGYTFFSVSQEKFLDELEDEAKVVRANYPKTSAN